MPYIRKRAGPPSLKVLLISLNQSIDAINKLSGFHSDNRKLDDVEFYAVVLEDRRFFFHSGIDFKSVIREIWKRATWKRAGGASTIDMQFVRVSTGRYERTLRRKTRESVLASLLRWQLSKMAILRSYLDIAYFGSGLNGVEQASQKMFGTSAENLRGYNAAFVAAMLVYPRATEPTGAWFERVNRRALYALRLGARLEKRFQEIGVR